MKKKLLFLIALFIVSVVAFSSATYAYFSKQYNPKIDNLRFNIATQEFLMISKTGEVGTFEDKIDFSEFVTTEDITLKPLKGVVSENSIAIYDGENPVSSDTNYVMFSLYFASSNDMDVYLEGSLQGIAVEIVRISNPTFTEEQVGKIVDSMRIGFLAYRTVITPSSSGEEISYSPINTNVYSVHEKTDSSYKSGLMTYSTFNSLGFTNGIEDDQKLIGVDGNIVSKMDIYIWIESEDINCDENVFNSSLQINLRFEAVSVQRGDQEEGEE